MYSNRVVLVYPGVLGAFKPEVPLSLLYLSSVLREKGYSCEIFDMRLMDYRKCDLSRVMCVGISSMTGFMIKHGLEFARAVRSYDKNIPIVWGGVHPSMLPEQTAENPLVDIVVRAEGELTFAHLIEAFVRKEPLDSVEGITFKRNGEIVSTASRPFMDLNTLPMELPYDLLEMDQYELSQFPVHTSRGCPARCTFCYNQSYNRGSFRYKSAERVLDEVEAIIQLFSVDSIAFTNEDNFFANKNRVERICRGFLERGIDIEWSAFCRFDYFSRYNDDFIGLLEKSGCRLISFGGESGSQEILDKVIHKGITIEQTKEGTRKIGETVITEIVSFMCGLPTETPRDLEKTMDLLDRLMEINPKAEPNGVVFFTPFPGTDLFDTVVNEYGFDPPKSLDEWQDYKIFRNVKCTWLDYRYSRRLQMLSIMTRFPFYTDHPKIPDRFSAFPYRPLYRILAYLARWRWKHRFIKFPLEWILVEMVAEKIRGFV